MATKKVTWKKRLQAFRREFRMMWSYAGKTNMFGYTYYRIPWFFTSLRSALYRARFGHVGAPYDGIF